MSRLTGHRAGPVLAGVITSGVGGAAAFVSWQHLNHLGHTVSATGEGAFLTPMTIDGMILVGTLELRQARQEGRPAKPWAYGAVLIGVVGTIAGNIAASTQDTLTARLYFAAPALAFLISVEVLFGKPLSRNLWDIVRSAWATRSPRRKASDRPGAPVREGGPVPVTAEPAPAGPRPSPAPQPDTTPDTAVPVENPQPDRVPQPPEEPAPEKPAEKPAERLTPRARPSGPGKGRTPARRSGRPPAGALPATAQVTGNRSRPQRLVDGSVLDVDGLKADARRRVAERFAGGAPRDGLGAWVARQYDPPLSDRWGQARVIEALGSPEPEPAVPVIEPLPVIEAAEPIEPEPIEPEPEPIEPLAEYLAALSN